MKHIILKVNGCDREVDVQENWTLLHVLREVLHLTGTKYACGTGDCGACKVLVDGEAKNSCVLNVVRMEGHEITTIEGLSKGDEIHPVQKAFIDAGAIQCGYCTPGMVITAVALLNKVPHPTHEQILEAFDNNLCRCTGYKKIYEAVQLAANRMKEE